jgi:SAM-dependent MidA family methyltransferase
MRSRTILEQAEFLMALGIPRREAAVVVGSTDESLRVLARHKAKKVAAKEGK